MNKAVQGEKDVRKAKFSIPVRSAAQQYQFIDLTPSTVARRFCPDREDHPYVDKPQQSFDFTVFTLI